MLALWFWTCVIVGSILQALGVPIGISYGLCTAPFIVFWLIVVVGATKDTICDKDSSSSYGSSDEYHIEGRTSKGDKFEGTARRK